MLPLRLIHSFGSSIYHQALPPTCFPCVANEGLVAVICRGRKGILSSLDEKERATTERYIFFYTKDILVGVNLLESWKFYHKLLLSILLVFVVVYSLSLRIL